MARSMAKNSVSNTWREHATRSQKEWARLLCTWKYFKKHHTDLLKTYIAIGLFGLADIENIHTTVTLDKYHKIYGNVQKQKIKIVFDQLNKLTKSTNGIEISHTYLYLSEKDLVYCIFRCRIENAIYFIEPTGRVYDSWKHFCATNQLPSDYYISPEHGVYSKDGEIVCYRTPETETSRKYENVAEWACAIAGIGCTVLGLFSIAPGFVVGTSLGISANCIYKSLSGLVDRKEHKQSVAPNNLESVLHWLNLSMSTLSGAALAAPVKSENILLLFGENCATALETFKSLRLSDLIIENGCLGTQLLHLYGKIEAGNFSSVDALELAVQVFFLYGAVTDVFQLRELIISKSKTNTRRGVLRGLREDWKQRLNSESAVVKHCSPHTALHLLANRNPKITLEFLLKFFPEEDVIMHTCSEIQQLTLKHSAKSITLNTYCGGARHHFANLWTMLEKNLAHWKYLLPEFLQSQPVVRNFAKLFYYAVTEIRRIESKIRATISDVEIRTAMGQILNEDFRHICVLNVARDLALKQVRYSTPLRIVLLFNDIVDFVTNTVEETATEMFNTLVAVNQSLIGRDNADAVFSLMEIHSVDDFYRNDSSFNKVMEKVKLKEFRITTEPSDIIGLPFQTVSEIINRLVFIYNSLFAKIANGDLGMHQSVETLRKMSTYVCNKFANRFENQTYEGNRTQLGAFNSAVSHLNIEQMALDIVSNREAFLEKNVLDAPICDGDEKCRVLLGICDLFYNTVKPMLPLFSEETLVMEKCYYFVVEKFIYTMKVKVRNGEGGAMFSKVVEMFTDNDALLSDLVSDFVRFQCDIYKVFDGIKIWNWLLHNRGMEIKYIECAKNKDSKFYKQKASDLFAINGDKYTVTENVNSVMLTSSEKYIIFSFMQGENAVIVTSVNLNN